VAWVDLLCLCSKSLGFWRPVERSPRTLSISGGIVPRFLRLAIKTTVGNYYNPVIILSGELRLAAMKIFNTM
jgi:hypothetical protein